MGQAGPYKKNETFKFDSEKLNFCNLMKLIVFLLFYICCVSSGIPAAVDLRTAGSYVVLSKTGVSHTGEGLITGNVATSPESGTALTGFSLTMDSSNEFSTSTYVVGKLFAADYSPPTPTVLTTAVGDMMTAYADAAGRTNPTATELGAGDISGMTLAGGLYKWSSAVSVDGTGVTLSGGSDDVWIFQIALALTFASSSSVTLAQGAQSKNIFWQVGDTVTVGTTASVHGNILSAKDIVLNTGSNLNGRVLAQTSATMNAATCTFPSNTEYDAAPCKMISFLVLFASILILSVF